MNRRILLLIISISFFGCFSNNDKNTINESEEKYLKSIELLENNEKILAFSTSLNIEKSGNFVSNKKIASYWIDQKPEKSYKYFALFSEIERIESEDNSKSWTYSSSLTIFKKDGSSFKVYIDGEKEKYENFKKIAIDNWKKNAP